jgi:hypothetical protein
MPGEVEEVRKIFDCAIGMARIWKPGVRIPELIEERVTHSFNGRQPLSGRVL